MQDQIEHKAAYLRTLEDQGLPVILVGHSIGAHIALELLRRFPDFVTKVIGLYPFLSVRRSAKLYCTFAFALVLISG